MRLTRRGIVVLLAAAALTGFGHAALTVDPPVPTPVSPFTVDAYEDGSGVVYLGTTEVATVPEGILPWDCTVNGNAVCGPEAPAEVRGPSCVGFVIGRLDTYLEVCTDGSVSSRPATDVDVEGEVV